MCTHVHDVALCTNIVRNVALGVRVVGHPCFIAQIEVQLGYLSHLSSHCFKSAFSHLKANNYIKKLFYLQNI